jgi:prevent-host-death family protein
MDIPAAQFKAECLKLMDRVARTRESIVITKHGRPVAQLVPVPPDNESLFGYMRGTLSTPGDVIAPANIEWSALSGDEDHLYELRGRSARPARKK